MSAPIDNSDTVGRILRDMDAGRIDVPEAAARMKALRSNEPWLERLLAWLL